MQNNVMLDNICMWFFFKPICEYNDQAGILNEADLNLNYKISEWFFFTDKN